MLIKLINTDLPSYFKEHYSDMFNELIPVNIHIKPNICVHIRLDDCAYYVPSYTNLKIKGESVINHINTKFTSDMDMTCLEKVTPWIQQHNCDLTKLDRFIKTIQKTYPDYNVDIICAPSPANYKFPDSFNSYNIIRNLSVDDSMYFMITSSILILSASTISFTSGLLHRGKQVYYPYWNHYFSYGLNTNISKSSWIMYDLGP